jgi:rod shape-determining protein MreD
VNSYVHTGAVLMTAYLAVFLQSSVSFLRNWTGTQMDLLPVLMVYCALSMGLGPLTLTAVLGGLAFDTLSANPLGITMLPLFLVGMAAYKVRELVLRDQPYARILLGAAASAAAPALSVLLLWGTGAEPLITWGSVFQWLLLAITGGLVTPVCFWFFETLNSALAYRRTPETTFRTDREIKRGRA